MSDTLEKLAGTAGMGQVEEKGRGAKKKFSPPVLHTYGEVVKICKSGFENQGEDEYGSPVS
jgi:hypothetical protein